MKISLENGAGTILEYIVLVSRAHSKYAGGKLGLDVSSIGFFSKRFYVLFLFFPPNSMAKYFDLR